MWLASWGPSVVGVWGPSWGLRYTGEHKFESTFFGAGMISALFTGYPHVGKQLDPSRTRVMKSGDINNFLSNHANEMG